MPGLPILKPAQPHAPQKEHPTVGYQQPNRNLHGTARGKAGCLCINRNYYSLKCCHGYLMEQGIGLVYGRNTAPVTYDNQNQ
jgi:hypothetical protein